MKGFDLQDFFEEVIDGIFGNERLGNLKQLAKEKNFLFKKREKFSEQSFKLKGFDIFRGKTTKRFKGIISIEDPDLQARVRIYDYFKSGASKPKTTIFEFHIPSLNLSKVTIRPKRTTKWVQEILGNSGTLFKELKQFHSTHEIIALNEEATNEELNESFLEMISIKSGLRMEGEGSYVLIYYGNKAINVKDLLNEYEFVLKAMDTLLEESVEEDEFV